MGWTVPWYSSYGSSFNADLGLDGGFGLSVLLRDHSSGTDEFFRTYPGHHDELDPDPRRVLMLAASASPIIRASATEGARPRAHPDRLAREPA
jgi:Bacterial protein of unknown function (DUF899)